MNILCSEQFNSISRSGMNSTQQSVCNKCCRNTRILICLSIALGAIAAGLIGTVFKSDDGKLKLSETDIYPYLMVSMITASAAGFIMATYWPLKKYDCWQDRQLEILSKFFRKCDEYCFQKCAEKNLYCEEDAVCDEEATVQEDGESMAKKKKKSFKNRSSAEEKYAKSVERPTRSETRRNGSNRDNDGTFSRQNHEEQ